MMYKSAFLLLFTFCSFASFSQTIQPDPDFGVGGELQTGYFDLNFNPYGCDMGVLPDGSIQAIGSAGSKPFALKYHPEGSLDSGYTTELPLLANSRLGFALQPDGKAIVVGVSANKMTVVRLNLEGGLDTTFGNGGVVKGPYGCNVYAHLLAQPDGKLVTYNDVYINNNHQILVSRWDANGDPDATFGAQGQAWVNVSSTLDYIPDGLVQPDGKLIFAGKANPYPLLLRFNPDGSRDSSFNHEGVLVDSLSEKGEYFSLRLQPDGKIVAGGYGTPSAKAVVVRYLTNGVRDSTFGNQGIVNLPNEGVEPESIGFEMLPSGKILVLVSALYETQLVRLLADGQIDTTFATNGIYKYTGENIRARYMQLNGNQLTVSGERESDQELVLLRFLLGSNVGLIEPSSDPAMFIYPNPVASGPFYLTFELKQSAQTEVALYDMNGRRLQELSPPHRLDPGMHEFKLDLPAQLPIGQYVVSLELDGGRRVGILVVVP